MKRSVQNSNGGVARTMPAESMDNSGSMLVALFPVGLSMRLGNQFS